MKFNTLALLSASLAILAACGNNPLLPADWREIPGPEGTMCAFGEPYRWYARSGTDPDKLMIYFQAGGACWSVTTCAEIAPGWNKTITLDDLRKFKGIFDFARADNPVAGYNIVFIPYCSGDVHAGATDVAYPGRLGTTVSIHHRGAINAQAALAWTYANYPSPKEVLVVGSSAGAIGAIYHTANVMQRYPQARIAQFGDGFVGVVPPGWEPLKVWNIYANLPPFIPELAKADPDTFTINAIYTATANHFPQHRFGQFTHAADTFQMGYYTLAGGNAANWHKQRDAFLGELEVLPNFRSYVGAGVLHTVLAFGEFYSMKVDDVRMRDWFADYIQFKPVNNVHCRRGTVSCP